MDRHTALTGLVFTLAFLAAAPWASAAETVELSDDLLVLTDAHRVSVSNGASPVIPETMVQLTNVGHTTATLRAQAFWQGSTEQPYQNNDTILIEVFNDTVSDSYNRSWAGSFPNAYNNIPAGVTDRGTRVGVIGWATSVHHPAKGYKHEGTLYRQIGVQGTAGFQSAGSGPSAVIKKATGVQGVVYSGSAGATIEDAHGGEFRAVAQVGIVQSAIAVLAEAAGAENANFSFYGKRGEFFNSDTSLFGSLANQALTAVAARVPGNAFEFGHPDPAGYGSTIGATSQHGFPFLAFSAEADPAGNTFTTRGKKGVVIHGDLAGGVVISRVPNAIASGQALVESIAVNDRGNLRLSRNPPASANAAGEKGEIAWDENYVYVCIAPNTWKRSALSSW